MNRIPITIDGTPYECELEIRLTLVDFLREELNLTVTHLGCEHGVCFFGLP